LKFKELVPVYCWKPQYVKTRLYLYIPSTALKDTNFVLFNRRPLQW